MKLSVKRRNLVRKYAHLFNNTGGNDVVELIEREGINYFNNCIVAELQGCCFAQLLLIETLIKEGLLKP